MKKIKDLTVTVKYTVSLGNVEVDDETYASLDKMADRFEVSGDEIASERDLFPASEWLCDNIHESDAYDWTYEVDFEPKEEDTK